ncbi:MAG TPA: flavin reductase family protein [Solirubrobacteraceae bacterium]|nr:flavin reductase family protein [Solirubrobacteraceae bacterium]
MAVDPETVREAHRRFPTGVTVVTAMLEGTPKGLSVNAFASVSLDPPTVLVCVSRTSRSYRALLRSEVIGINLLSQDQEAVARTFAGKAEDKFAEVDWACGPCGAPLLDGASAQFEVAPENLALASTHVVIIGRVVSCAHSTHPPLLYIGGAFHPAPVTELTHR